MTNTLLPKKPRGRPRKNSNTSFIEPPTNTTPLQETPVVISTDIEALPLKKRGRPKKIVQNPSTFHEQDSSKQIPNQSSPAQRHTSTPSNPHTFLEVLVNHSLSENFLKQKHNSVLENLNKKESLNDISQSTKENDVSKVEPEIKPLAQPKIKKTDTPSIIFPNQAALQFEQDRLFAQNKKQAMNNSYSSLNRETNPGFFSGYSNKKSKTVIKKEQNLYSQRGYQQPQISYTMKQNEFLISLILLCFGGVCLLASFAFFLFVSQPNSFNLQNGSIDFKKLETDLHWGVTETYKDISNQTKILVQPITKELPQNPDFYKDKEDQQPTTTQRTSNLPLDGVTTQFNNTSAPIVSAIDAPSNFNWEAGNLDFAWNGTLNPESQKMILALKKQMKSNTKIQILIYPTQTDEKNIASITQTGETVYKQFLDLGFHPENLNLIPPAIYLENNPNTLDITIVHIIWI